MREELDRELCEKYPKIFAQRNLPMSETCMCWGLAVGDGWYDIIDVLCANIQGRIDARDKEIERCARWHEMRNAALAGDWTIFDEKNADRINDPKWAEWIDRERARLVEPEVPCYMEIQKSIPQVEAVQVKEKFGGLRFYVDGGDDYTRGLIAMAEDMSFRICEVCGKPGQLRQGGWILTLCDEHHNDRSWKDQRE